MNPRLHQVAAEFVADAGDAADLEILVLALATIDRERGLDIAHALTARGRMVDVPAVFRFYEVHREHPDCDSIPARLRWLLGSSEDGDDDPSEHSWAEYRAAIARRYFDLWSRLGTNLIHVRRGRAYDLRTLVHDIKLIIVPTNGQQVEAAMKDLASVSGDATFFLFSSNWDGLAAYDAILPRERYLLGYPDGGGTVKDGVYWTNLGAEVHLGLVEGQSAARLEQVKNVFTRADMKPDMQENMLHWLWIHNAGVIGFAAGLAKYRVIDPYLADNELVYQSIRATKELYDLCAQRGVDLKKYPEIGYIKFPIWLVAFLLRRNFRRNVSMQRYTAHAVSEGSRRESKFHYAQVMQSAAELGFEMPNLNAMGKYLAMP